MEFIRFKLKAKILCVIWDADLYKYLPVKSYNNYTSDLIMGLESKIKSKLSRIYLSIWNVFIF